MKKKDPYWIFYPIRVFFRRIFICITFLELLKVAGLEYFGAAICSNRKRDVADFCRIE